MKRQPLSPRASWLAGLAGVSLLLGAAMPAQAQLQNGLVAYWPFEGNFEDQAGSFDGQPQGSAAIPFVPSKTGLGQAIRLNGEDQYVLIPDSHDALGFNYDPNTPGTGNMSMSAWIRVEAWDTSWQAIIAHGEGDEWRFHRRGDSATRIGYTAGKDDTPDEGDYDVNDGEWHHIVGTADSAGDICELWVDGVLVTTDDAGIQARTDGNDVRIGDNPDATGREWEGELDDIALWNRVLTEAEIQALYTSGGSLLGLLNPDDTDSDGLPDWWEEQYGLNPNDPADAGEDCNGNGLTNLEEFQANLDPCDDEIPVLLSVRSDGTFNTVTVNFSKQMDAATAEDTANYTIVPELGITGASLNGTVVTLTTDPQTPGGTKYTVTASGVKDISQFEVPEGSNTASFYSYFLTRQGVWQFSYWGGIGGTPVQNLLDDPRYPDSPDMIGPVFSTTTRDIFPNDSHDNYGAVMEGLLTPEETGAYYFFLSSDDASRLDISTDASPANLLEGIAEEIGCCNAFQEPGAAQTTPWALDLVGGQSYYIRVLLKEGGGGDYAHLAWRKSPDDDAVPAASLSPIPGRFLSSPVDLAVPSEGTLITQTPGPNAVGVAPNAGITVVHSDGSAPWTDANVSLKLDGEDVAATVTRDGTITTITYQPGSLFAAASAHTVELTHPDPEGNPATMAWSFTVMNYPTIPAALGTAPGTGAEAGMNWRTHQTADARNNQIAERELQLAGDFGASIHDTTGEVGGLFLIDFVNFEQDAGSQGNFNAGAGAPQNVPDVYIPGIPSGHAGGTDNIAGECFAYIEFLTAGLKQMVVNSDDGFEVTTGINGTTLEEKKFLSLGLFDGGRGATDTVFYFVVEAPGVYYFRLLWFEGGGGANVEWFTLNGDGSRALVNGVQTGSLKAYRTRTVPEPELPAACATIGLNFGADEASGSNSGTLAPGEVAGVVPQANWNNLTLNTGTSAAIVDENGAATSVAVEWNSNNTWSTTGRGEENNCQLGGADGVLMTGYLDSTADSTTTVKITGLPACSYDLYLYALGGVAGRGGAYRVLDANTGTELRGWRQVQGPDCPICWVQAPANADTSTWEPGNYVLFCDLNAPDIIVEASTQVDAATGADLGFGATQRAPLNAVQMVFPATCQPPNNCPPVLTYTFDPPETLCVDWDVPAAILEEAPTVLGPWTPVADTSKPYCTTTTGTQMYYRAVVPPTP